MGGADEARIRAQGRKGHGPHLGDQAGAAHRRHLDADHALHLDAGLSARTVLQCHRIISAALNQTVKWSCLTQNVARLATPPSATKTKVVVPSQAQLRRLSTLARSGRSSEVSTFIQLAAVTGMRRGEICRLRWSDVDDAARALRLRRSYWQRQGQSGVKEPKNGKERTVPIGTGTVQRSRCGSSGRWS